MAATIKPIEAKSIHQIQAGQVIVDLCSVVKELVENALDAQATSVEVRFKNYGLESIEVQDNGTGIAEANYEGLARKHHTSKLSTYDDLSRLQTFGFRGEALSSLCAVSTLTVNTAQAHEAPKGKRLEFEPSGELKSTSLVATSKGTTAVVEELFARLPVRQKELSKHIKREYGKVLGLLHAYACISTMVKFTVKNAAAKSRSVVAFSSRGNATTRDNIANVYGTKVLSQLIDLDMQLDFPSSYVQPDTVGETSSRVTVVGHISKPVFGEGRQTPDRQMFFVNGRPCGLPQISKAINEVYKSYNVSQSPFIFIDLKLDANSYDVNVSPDKRTIFLHNAGALTEGLKSALIDRFDRADQTVPQSQRAIPKLPTFKPLTITRVSSADSEEPDVEPELPIRSSPLKNGPMGYSKEQAEGDDGDLEAVSPPSLLKSCFGAVTTAWEDLSTTPSPSEIEKKEAAAAQRTEKIAQIIQKKVQDQPEVDEYDDLRDFAASRQQEVSEGNEPHSLHIHDFNACMKEQLGKHYQRLSEVSEAQPPTYHERVSEKGAVPNAFDRIRPRRLSPELATITIGDKVITRMIGSQRGDNSVERKSTSVPQQSGSLFYHSLRQFEVGHTGGRSEMYTSKGLSDQDRVEIADHDESPSSNASSSEASEEDAEQQQPASPQQDTLAIDPDKRPRATTTRYDEITERIQEENRVKELIRKAEESNKKSIQGQRRLKGGISKDSTVNLLVTVDTPLDALIEQSKALRIRTVEQFRQSSQADTAGVTNASEEERLSLTISKSDFAKMHIAGQFNLGFIIAVRHKVESEETKQNDEIFIIDQHASDEKYNFERLQAETVVGNQRLVHPVMLDLTAVEEEIVLENTVTLQRNGFIVETDLSGELSVGSRCQLMSLPLSKETTLGIRDLEELIHLLSETHMTAKTTSIPRPSKIRRMFAMRACRSSIMIGKTLSKRQMRNVLDHMGNIDKPWNCPHGRPTMRHLISLDDLDGQLWNEYDGVVSDETVQNISPITGGWEHFLA